MEDNALQEIPGQLLTAVVAQDSKVQGANRLSILACQTLVKMKVNVSLEIPVYPSNAPVLKALATTFAQHHLTLAPPVLA